VGITTHCVYCIDAHSQKAIDSGVSALVDRSGMSQPLVSQHLRTLRQAGIVTVSRSGREAVYQLADHHIAHVVDDAITHVLEETPENEREQA
jgi:DNA-binding transcriptional ArsR family regulator